MTAWLWVRADARHPPVVQGVTLASLHAAKGLEWDAAFLVGLADGTLPIYIFSSIRCGITPEVNAIGTVVLAVSLTLLILAQFLLRERKGWAGRHAA